MDQVLAKYQELYSLSQDAVAKQIERIRRAEDKASRFASLSALLITLSALAAKFVLESFIPPTTLLGWACLISYLFFLATLLYASVNILRSLRLVTIDIPPMNEEMVRFFDKEEYIDIIYALAKRNCDIIKKNAVVYEQKLGGLLRTYKALLFSIIFISAFFISLILWINQKPTGGKQTCPTIITNPHNRPAHYPQNP